MIKKVKVNEITIATMPKIMEMGLEITRMQSSREFRRIDWLIAGNEVFFTIFPDLLLKWCVVKLAILVIVLPLADITGGPKW
jgi:hypothetical protein